MTYRISMMLNDWSFWRWINLNWRWPAAVRGFTLRFIASSRSQSQTPVFRFGWDDVTDDCSFVLSRYFPGESQPDKSPIKHERYAQREKICALYGHGCQRHAV